MDKIQQEIDYMKKYINAMKKHDTSGDCDNLLIHLNNIQEQVKIITYEPVLATGLTNEQILDEAARREANISLQYEDYSLETWTVATKLLPHRKAYLLDDGSIRKFRIEYEM